MGGSAAPLMRRTTRMSRTTAEDLVPGSCGVSASGAFSGSGAVPSTALAGGGSAAAAAAECRAAARRAFAAKAHTADELCKPVGIVLSESETFTLLTMPGADTRSVCQCKHNESCSRLGC